MESREVMAMLQGLGSAWRGDWSFFDGRTLRDQLAGVVEFIDEQHPEMTADSFLRAWDICPDHGQWFEYCDDCEQYPAASPTPEKGE